MTNRALHRRLTVIEARYAQAAAAVERERRLVEQKRISPDEAERIYRRLMAPVPRTQASRKQSLEQSMAQYFRMVRGSAPRNGTSL